MHTKFWTKHLKGRNHEIGPGTDGRIIFIWIIKK